MPANENGRKPRRCGYKTVNQDTGNRLNGTAAMLHIMKKDGGPDAHISKIAEKAAKNAIKEVQEETRKPNLTVKISNK